MGKGNFRPPRESTPSTDHQKICHRWLSRRLLQLCQIWCTFVHGGLLGEWVKYTGNQNFFYIFTYALLENSIWWLKRRGLVQGRAFLGFCWQWSPFRGKIPQNLNFGAWIGIFKPNSQNQKNMHIIKTTASIPTKFCAVIKTTKCPSWAVRTHTSQIQDGGQPPSWNNQNITITPQWFDRFRPNLARRRSSTLLSRPTV